MQIERIFDHTDPRTAIYRNLKDKDLRRDNSFIIEGKFTLETLLTRSKFKVSSVFISEDRLLPLETLLNRLPASAPIFVTSHDVMAQIAGYSVHRGILAAGVSTTSGQSSLANITAFNRIAVLSNISNPDNIGAIFRNAAGLGIEAVLLDAQCCSPLYRKAIRVSMGATLVLPWVQCGGVQEMLGQLKSVGFTAYGLSSQSARRLEDVQFQRRSAFLFGEEAHGLPLAVQAGCEVVSIPMSAGTDSLNVAATSAIVFDAARRQQS